MALQIHGFTDPEFHTFSIMACSMVGASMSSLKETKSSGLVIAFKMFSGWLDLVRSVSTGILKYCMGMAELFC